MNPLPTVDFCGHQVSRLICGGNPLSGFSHFDPAMDRAMLDYFTMPRIQKLWDDCLANGINTIQTRGDKHMMRAYLEHRQNGGKLQWIAQTASEFADIKGNIAIIASYKPIAIYVHGTYTDNSWHKGKLDAVHDLVKAIKDQGLPAGVGSHVPKVLETIEEQGWETDFYMGCFYNLSRKVKAEVARGQRETEEKFPAEDPARMAQTIRQISKPCIGFKILAASRSCGSAESIRKAFEFAYANIKPTDIVDVGMFPRDKDQVAENSSIVREILGS